MYIYIAYAYLSLYIYIYIHTYMYCTYTCIYKQYSTYSTAYYHMPEHSNYVAPCRTLPCNS